MKDAPTQLDIRENTASSRPHASRAAIHDSFRQFGPLRPTEPFVKSTQELGPATKATFELSLRDSGEEATGRGDGETIASELPIEQSNRLSVERPLTCEEAADFVRVHPRTVKRMARAGKVPAHFRFGRWYFYASELDCWMRMELHSTRHP
jgi:excisionase family DNA binding protein